MLTELQKKTSQAIVNIFETGRPLGDYGRVTVPAKRLGAFDLRPFPDHPGQLGIWPLSLHDYCNADGQWSHDLKPFLPGL